MRHALFALNGDIDRSAVATRFQADGRVQIRNLLTEEAALTLASVLANQTPWGLAWRSGDQEARYIRANEYQRLSEQHRAELRHSVFATVGDAKYGFQFRSYPMLEAYLGKWAPDGVHDLILEHINDQPFLDLMRDVTGITELAKADAQATLYAPGHFLAQHDDSHVKQGWKVAYVLNLCPVVWKADWGGYLNFLDDDGDVIAGWRPRFNTLNLFLVPQPHQVTFVPPFAPVARYAITGWLRTV
jgi:Rps23 Pro-64 3,4-dihydroxylase Tpa1-like proline 4-hydroxylase